MIDYEKMFEKAKIYGVELKENQLVQLDQYAELLVDWNSHINLTAITDPEGIMVRHFEDCIAVFKFVDIPLNSKVIDVGTGAGFPGMVLKIVRTDLSVTLLDSLRKRIIFLDEVAQQINVDVSTIHSRAEDGGKQLFLREGFDFALARAVSNLRELAEYCIPYVSLGGYFISMKGPDASSELDTARTGIGILGGKVRSVNNYSISDGSGRTIIAIEKIRQTPLNYPRPSAKIKNKPL